MKAIDKIGENKKAVVISGPNLVDGGPISVFYDFLDATIEGGYAKKYNIVALVGRKELFNKYSNEIELIEFRKSKSNWLYRLYYEYFYFKRLSSRIEPYIWVSMHDITPNVYSQKLYTYCHNSSPFNKMSIRDVKYGLKYYLFSKFYKYLYKINIKKANAIIVQQDWMREVFEKIFSIDDVIVARPSFDIPVLPKTQRTDFNKKVFIYPSFPRYYKNFEICCEAANRLVKNGITNFELIITLSGNENRYAKDIKKKYGSIKNIIFLGIVEREKIFQLYSDCDCLLFMSKLETWGMPIMEYKASGKPMIVADLPYAHETVGIYDGVEFVNPDDADLLATYMNNVINEGILEGKSISKNYKPPFANDWGKLCEMIFK